ncbi:hypothetical protein JG687_00004879 [Phytophthora cactorum]|uniref:Uncharacterized protein n=1 Tax=Phytophthora cactorum TaxID=29920 RepID=A0A8T1US28_9STRA|nr:hypothetical protein Pcac1_g1770 [Phytophthora cactorum]KAG3119981.1 hypothetical protein PI125_g1508 [Phytophthora idaei]KAG2828247.1 hypothetical protein PC112_g8539 [Phytophthora cactorum]KAG2859299.1 hypothetical protein PC113_g9079 [Phytophthora cactorum]KAG3023281.1 hypothetical protein PC119_g8976 [Phytophthora cactorum]
MSPIAVWHWQERFEPVNVEDACRRQILKIRKSKSYNLWLKEKSRANSKQSHVQEPGYDDDNQGRQAEIDAAFRDWLRQKQTSKKQKNAVDTKPNLQCKPWCKPPSLHVNLKTKKGSTRKAEHASITKANSTSYLHREHSKSENQQAYNAWLARVRLEDRVRRTQRRDELDRLEKQQREKHKITWRKKVAVCAYSTLAVYS